MPVSTTPLTSADGRLAQQPLDVRDAEVPAGRRLQRRPADVDLRGQRRGELGLADPGQRVGDGGVRRQDDRLGGHHAAGRVVGVGEQPAQRGGLVGLHQLEQLLGVVLRQLGEQVGGVVGLHRLEDVGGALLLELAEDLDLVVLGQLLEDVGERLVVERGGDLDPALGATARAARWRGRRR